MRYTFHLPVVGRVHLLLVNNWRAILLRAWSVRLMVLGFAFQVLEQLLPYIDEDSFGIPHPIFRVLTMVVLVGAVWARFTPQPKTIPPVEKADAGQ